MSASNPSSLSLTSITDGSSMVASPVRNNFSDVQTAVNALIAVLALAIAKGDMLVASASGVYDHLAVGANSKALIADSAQTVGVKWDYPPGYKYAHNEFTADVSITATTEGTANTVVTATAVTFDGSTEVVVEFFSPYLQSPGTAGANVELWLYLDGASIGAFGYVSSSGATTVAPAFSKRLLTPAAGSRTYSVRASVNTGTGIVRGGPGGSGAWNPGYIRITKA